jgi:hypothetical protein
MPVRFFHSQEQLVLSALFISFTMGFLRVLFDSSSVVVWVVCCFLFPKSMLFPNNYRSVPEGFPKKSKKIRPKSVIVGKANQR